MSLEISAVKADLGITWADDDATLTRLIAAAAAFITNHTRRDLATDYGAPDAWPDDLAQAGAILVKHWWQNRDAIASGATSATPDSVLHLLAAYRDLS